MAANPSRMGGGVLDSIAYRKGFEDALDVALKIMQDDDGSAFGEISELATKVRLEKAGQILDALNGR